MVMNSPIIPNPLPMQPKAALTQIVLLGFELDGAARIDLFTSYPRHAELPSVDGSVEAGNLRPA